MATGRYPANVATSRQERFATFRQQWDGIPENELRVSHLDKKLRHPGDGKAEDPFGVVAHHSDLLSNTTLCVGQRGKQTRRRTRLEQQAAKGGISRSPVAAGICWRSTEHPKASVVDVEYQS